MRDKFSEMIAAGVARFDYTNIAHPMGETDPVCRAYNNIFSIPTDTRMACLEDGRRVITGHMVGSPDWERFVCSTCWGAVCFKTAGVWSLCDFLHQYGLEGRIGNLNSDLVYIVEPVVETRAMEMPASVTTSESSIPEPISFLTTSNNIMHIKECFIGDVRDICRRMNESVFVKGTNWVPSENGIVGLVGNKVYIL